jgi:solute carrier family 31 (copper transporter), member 1
MSHSEMVMNGSSNSTGGMVPWLHFTPGDVLLFQDWAPTTPGAVFGACVGLFMLAIIDRWLAALRRFMEIWWAER